MLQTPIKMAAVKLFDRRHFYGKKKGRKKDAFHKDAGNRK